MTVRLLGEEAIGDTISRVIAIVRPSRRVVGWATIDLDRLGPGAEASDDDLLGAGARLLSDGRLALEPRTEGRLAASLARHGEGPVALYLIGGEVPGESALLLSKPAAGPFGPQQLVLGGPRWGPHLLVVGPATISP